MSQFNFQKFIDRINLIGTSGSIHPQDWDTSINICIMQAIELATKLEKDEIDLYDLTSRGRTLSLTDHPKNVDAKMVSMFISYNDGSSKENRNKLMRLFPKLKDSELGQSVSEQRIKYIHNVAKQMGYQDNYDPPPGAWWAQNYPDAGIRVFSDALDIGKEESSDTQYLAGV